MNNRITYFLILILTVVKCYAVELKQMDFKTMHEMLYYTRLMGDSVECIKADSVSIFIIKELPTIVTDKKLKILKPKILAEIYFIRALIENRKNKIDANKLTTMLKSTNDNILICLTELQSAHINLKRELNYEFNINDDVLNKLKESCIILINDYKLKLKLAQTNKSEVTNSNSSIFRNSNLGKWKPPSPSTYTLIDNEMLNNPKTYKEASLKLQDVLKAGGYYQYRFFTIDDGYIILTALEKTQTNGLPAPIEERWNLDKKLNEEKNGDWLNYVYNLIAGVFDPVALHYRQYMFIITTCDPVYDTLKADYRDFSNVMKKGLTILPNEVADKKYTSKHFCLAYIYEYQQTNNDKIPNIQFQHFDAITHLRKSNMWNAFNQNKMSNYGIKPKSQSYVPYNKK